MVTPAAAPRQRSATGRSAAGRIRTHGVAAASSAPGLRFATASITVTAVMLLTVDTMFTLIHGAASGVRNTSRWPQPQLAQPINDAASGV